MNNFSDDVVDQILNRRLRRSLSPMPFSVIAAELGLERDGLERFVWGVVTGYTRTGKRREYHRGRGRVDNAGTAWTCEDEHFLKLATGGDALRRDPPVDDAHIARVLARPIAEIEAKLDRRRGTAKGGFGL